MQHNQDGAGDGADAARVGQQQPTAGAGSNQDPIATSGRRRKGGHTGRPTPRCNLRALQKMPSSSQLSGCTISSLRTLLIITSAKVATMPGRYCEKGMWDVLHATPSIHHHHPGKKGEEGEGRAGASKSALGGGAALHRDSVPGLPLIVQTYLLSSGQCFFTCSEQNPTDAGAPLYCPTSRKVQTWHACIDDLQGDRRRGHRDWGF